MKVLGSFEEMDCVEIFNTDFVTKLQIRSTLFKVEYVERKRRGVR